MTSPPPESHMGCLLWFVTVGEAHRSVWCHIANACANYASRQDCCKRINIIKLFHNNSNYKTINGAQTLCTAISFSTQSKFKCEVKKFWISYSSLHILSIFVGNNYSLQLQCTLIIILFTVLINSAFAVAETSKKSRLADTAAIFSTSESDWAHLTFASVVNISVQPGQAYTTSSKYPNRDRPVELRCRCTVSVEQYCCCSMENRDDTAHFQVTTQGLSVRHLMCRRTDGTSTTARCCCGVFSWFWRGAGYKTADLLTSAQI